MEHLWSWSGRLIGFRRDRELWTFDGRHVGRFVGDEVFGQEGAYLGELANRRLITNLSKADKRVAGFDPEPPTERARRLANLTGCPAKEGYEDFPRVEL